MIRLLSREYGFTPSEVGQLTFYQLRTYLADEVEIDGRRVVSLAEIHAMRAERAKGK